MNRISIYRYYSRYHKLFRLSERQIRVINYLLENGKATITQLVENCDCELVTISTLVRRDLLIFDFVEDYYYLYDGLIDYVENKISKEKFKIDFNLHRQNMYNEILKRIQNSLNS